MLIFRSSFSSPEYVCLSVCPSVCLHFVIPETAQFPNSKIFSNFFFFTIFRRIINILLVIFTYGKQPSVTMNHTDYFFWPLMSSFCFDHTDVWKTRSLTRQSCDKVKKKSRKRQGNDKKLANIKTDHYSLARVCLCECVCVCIQAYVYIHVLTQLGLNKNNRTDYCRMYLGRLIGFGNG